MNSLIDSPQKAPARVFQEEGILFYPQVFAGDELDRLREACEVSLQRNLEHIDCEQPEQKNISNIRHVEHPRWHSQDKTHWKVLMETAADPRCLGPVEQVFQGTSLFRCTSLFFNPRFESSEGNWHRDIQFVVPSEDEVKAQIGSRPCGGVQFQIALIDNDDIEYVPFSPGRYDTEEEYYFRCADGRKHCREAGMPDAVRIQQKAGDGIIFNADGLHRGRYHTDIPRRTLMLTYTPRNRPTSDWFSDQPWMLERGYLDDLSPRARVYFEDFISVYRDYWTRAR